MLVNRLFPWRGGRWQVLYLTDVWLKKGGRFFRRSVSTFLLISLKLFLFSLQRSWSSLAYCMGYFSSIFLLIKGGYISLLFWFGFSDLTQICVVCQIDITANPRFGLVSFNGVWLYFIWFVASTFETVNETLWCDHSIEFSLAVFLLSIPIFLAFYQNEMKNVSWVLTLANSGSKRQ